MLPTNEILDALVDLLAADAATLAPPALPLHLHLAKAAFTPAATLTVAGLTEATFDGSTALNIGVGPQDVFKDPLSGLRVIQLLEPAGGFHWQTTGLTDLPQTIYGWYVTDNGDANVLGSGLFATPLPLSAVGQGVDIPMIRFTFLQNSPT